MFQPEVQEKKIILVVDDVPANIQIVHSILRDQYRTRIATTPEKALELARTQPRPDLILLDVVMPRMDGYQVCAELKADPATSRIPVIFLTGQTDVEDEMRGFDSGAVDYIHKPFSPPVVKARVHTHLALCESLAQLETEKRRSDQLLSNMLPEAAVGEIKATGMVKPRRFENVAVLFCDLVGFTGYCDRHAPEEVVRDLGGLFVAFERCAHKYGMEKIKTVGDAFLATAGLLKPSADPLKAALDCALELCNTAASGPQPWQVRAGIHVGPVVAGVVGTERYQFDIWGDTVNVAARLTSAAAPGSAAIVESLAVAGGVSFSSSRAVELKGKGVFRVAEVTPPRAVPVRHSP